MKSLLYGVLAIVLGTFAGLALLEGSLRLFPSLMDLSDPKFFNDTTRFAYDPDVGYTNVRNAAYARSAEDETGDIALRYNSLGYRGGEFPDPAEGVLRVAAIGDSFTEGLHVEEDRTWPERLEAELAPDAAVYNLGVHNYGLLQYLLTARHKLGGIHPDVVVFGIYVHNDIGYQAPLTPSALDPSKRLRLKQFLYNAKKAFSRPAPQNGTLAQDSETASACSFPPFSTPEYNASYEKFYAGFQWQYKPRSEEFEKNLASTFAYLEKIHELTPAPHIFVLIPAREQIQPYWWNTHKCLYGLKDADRFAVQRALSGWFTRQGIPFLDLAPAFVKVSDPSGLYLRFDGHWDEAGHALAAREIAGAIAFARKGL